MTTPRILFIQGGWDGHFPDQVVARFTAALHSLGVSTETITALDRLADADWLRTFDAISPCWTMGMLTPDQSNALQSAVRTGTGLAGTHGGMGDAFRGDLGYEWMTGGHFVGHPHRGPYNVRVTEPDDPIMAGLPREFTYDSEQYYMLIDPAVRVLADADYTHEGQTCVMPVVWTKAWGNGRVFYSALGHAPDEFDRWPEVFEMSVRGLLWAARAL